jgi:hypothetical protein
MPEISLDSDTRFRAENNCLPPYHFCLVSMYLPGWLLVPPGSKLDLKVALTK